MPIGKLWIRLLLFVFMCVFVWLRISWLRIKLAASNCTAVSRRPRQGITQFAELCSQKPKIGRIGSDDRCMTRACSRATIGSACMDVRPYPKTDVLVLFYKLRVLVLESWCKRTVAPSLRSPVVDEERIRSVIEVIAGLLMLS